MAEWTLANATQIRANLTKEQEDEISMLYRKVYLQVRKQMLAIPKDGTTSQQIQRQYLDKLHKQLDEAYKSLGVGLEKQIEKGAKKAAQGVVDDSTEFFSKAGLTIEGAYSFVPKDIVNALVTGQVYGGNWSLSGAIWSDIDKKQSDINRIIAEGVAANKSAYDIAKDLETYVDPKAKKEWDWSKVYPGTSKKVDYNAQRLARTMISHAYQQSLERVCKNNPFVEGFIWQSAHSSRVCPICAERDGQFYKKGELPLDHPNGMCTFIASIQGSMNDVADRLADWANGKSDPALDKWATSMSQGKTMGRQQVKLSATVKDPLELKDLPKTTLKEASEAWFEYEEANLMSEYIRTGKMPSVNLYQQKVSKADQERLMSQALMLQEKAEKSRVKNKVLYRGMVLQDEDLGAFKRNALYTFDTLSASATSKDIAMIYADVDNAGGEGTAVILEIENPKGVRGYARDELEVILPKGSSYRVSRTYYEGSVLHVSLYASKGLG